MRAYSEAEQERIAKAVYPASVKTQRTRAKEGSFGTTRPGLDAAAQNTADHTSADFANTAARSAERTSRSPLGIRADDGAHGDPVDPIAMLGELDALQVMVDLECERKFDALLQMIESRLPRL